MAFRDDASGRLVIAIPAEAFAAGVGPAGSSEARTAPNQPIAIVTHLVSTVQE